MTSAPQVRNVNFSLPSFFRIRRFGDDWLLTNQAGQYLFLNADEYDALSRDRIEQDGELYQRLAEANLIQSEADIDDLSTRLRKRRARVVGGEGPSIQRCIVTNECYGPPTGDHFNAAAPASMTQEVADHVVQFILKTPARHLHIGFGGGEPLLNWSAVQRIIDGLEAGVVGTGQEVQFTLNSNLHLMTDEHLAYLLEHRVHICTSVDGPRDIHDALHSEFPNAFAQTESQLRRIVDAYADQPWSKDRNYVEAELRPSVGILGQAANVVETYAKLGVSALAVRPLLQVGNERPLSMPQILQFYDELLTELVVTNKAGGHLVERNAAILMARIQDGNDVGVLDPRNSGGLGLHSLAYGPDGQVYTNETGWEVSNQGDDLFKLGSVQNGEHDSFTKSDIARAIVMASVLDGSPGCVNCTYLPFCTTSPEFNYRAQGSLGGRMPESRWCGFIKGVQDILFQRMLVVEPNATMVLDGWTKEGFGQHFVL